MRVMGALLAALGVAAVLIVRWGGAMGLNPSGALVIELACAGVAGAFSGAVAWKVIDRSKRPSPGWGAVAGLFAVVLGHLLTMSLLTAPLIWSGTAGETWNSLAKWTFAVPMFALGSFMYIGWLTLPVGLILGIMCWRVQGRRAT